MPVRRETRAGKLLRVVLALGVVLTMALVVGAAGAAASAPARSASAVPCVGTATGAPWSLKGQHGTTYTILGEGGASCTLGAAWLKRISASRGTKSPKGWSCLATSGVGECQVKGGGIFEFSPKLKK